jgi:glycosyltransferase involved in cell wall biosynthesis
VRIFIEDSKYADRVTHSTGYAEVHRGLIVALDTLGVEVGFPRCGAQIAGSGLLRPEVKARLLSINARPFTDDAETVYLQIAPPDSFSPRSGRFNAGLTMTERESLAYYEERFDWVGLCNAMNLILTPTEWNRLIFESHGIRSVVVAPLGVDVDFFAPAPYRFLSVLTGFGRRGSRSNWWDIAEAFRTEFSGDPDVRLTFLSQGLRRPFEYSGLRESLSLLPEDIAAYIRGLKEQPVIDVQESGDLSQQQMREIYRSHDCYVSYSREGWGLPILEAMACSLEMIACDYGAPMSYLAGSPARLFAAGQLSEDNLKFVGGDREALRRHMRHAYEQDRRTKRFAQSYSWETAAAGLARVLSTAYAAWRAR